MDRQDLYRKWMRRELDRTGKTQAALAEALSLDAVKMSKVFSGARRIQASELELAAAFLGSPIPGNAKLVRSFDPDEMEANIDSAELGSAAQGFPKDAIRELVAKGGMGSGQVITTSFVRDGVELTATDAVRDDYWKFPSDFVRSSLRAQVANLLAIECQGDSMEPTIQPGERVWIDTAHKKPSPDGVYAIRDTLGEIVVKRLELTDDKPPRVAVISDNKNHGRKVYGLDEIVVVGRLVCSLRLF